MHTMNTRFVNHIRINNNTTFIYYILLIRVEKRYS